MMAISDFISSTRLVTSENTKKVLRRMQSFIDSLSYKEVAGFSSGGF